MKISCRALERYGACLGLGYDETKELGVLNFVSIDNKTGWTIVAAYEDTRPQRTEIEVCAGYLGEEDTWECDTDRKKPSSAYGEIVRHLDNEGSYVVTQWREDWKKFVSQFEKRGMIPAR